MHRLRSYLCELQLGRKNKHRLNFILHTRTNLIDPYMIYPIPHEKARQSPFKLPPRLDVHATLSHENGDRAPSDPPSTRQHQRRRRARPRCRPPSTRTRTKQNYKNGSRRQVIEGGGVHAGALRGQGCTNWARSESEISVSRFIYRQNSSLHFGTSIRHNFSRDVFV